ncbi:hypothetical protein ACFS2C_15060 [Prauserella oleivorans]|uniref:Uncharacterized protein n=1 Tax=Prauserella oleivorans TaxID=1478153 RepID=A0ABW5W9Z6_9PSEU
MLLRKGVAVMVASGAAVVAMATPAAAGSKVEAQRGSDRGMARICEMMMQDFHGMERMRETMMRNPAMARMCEMMMRQDPAMAEMCKSMMGDTTSQA